MKNLGLLGFFLFSISFGEHSHAAVGCRQGFQVESIEAYSFDSPDNARQGRFQVGLLRTSRQAKRQGGKDATINSDVIAYTVLKADDPAFLQIKEAKQKGLFFEACFESEVAEKISGEGRCSTCTARGEIQGLVKLYSIGQPYSSKN